MYLPSGREITFTYISTSGLHDNHASRVTSVKDGANRLATYDYNGLDTVVGTTYEQPDVMWKMYGSTSGDYPDLDRFNRVTSSRWTKDLAADIDFFDTDITYDRNSNITSVTDNVHSGFDVIYTMDDLDRLERAEEGTISGGSITSRTRDQQWTLTQTGNWNVDKVDLNGDGDFTDTDDLDDDRTHNDVNELTGRDIDDSGSDDYTLTYDAAGNLTDDGENYEYEWDAFYRLRKINDTSDQSLVAEFKYNGLGYRISVHEDTDDDGDVDASDKWYHSAFDERWRIVGTYREDDSDPKEEFVNHNAGLGGSGKGSYIDLIAARDRDANTAWTSASDGTLEERIFYCQNWRADVVALVDGAGQMVEWVNYSAYGIPYGLPGGDADSDGDCDTADEAQVQAWIAAPAYDVRGDIDLDGDVDSSDKSTIQASYSGISLGRRALSAPAIENRRARSGAVALLRDGETYAIRYELINALLGHSLNRGNYGPIGSPTSYASVNLGSTPGYGNASGFGQPGCSPKTATYSANQAYGSILGEQWILGRGNWVPGITGLKGRCIASSSINGCNGGGWRCLLTLQPMFKRPPMSASSNGEIGTENWNLGPYSTPKQYRTVQCDKATSPESIDNQLYYYWHGENCPAYSSSVFPEPAIYKGDLQWGITPNPCLLGSGNCSPKAVKFGSGQLNYSSSPYIVFTICAGGPKKLVITLSNGMGGQSAHLRLTIGLPCQ